MGFDNFQSLRNVRCNCNQTGFTGRLCNDPIDVCKIKQPCQNGGICENMLGSFKCYCPADYNGTLCENKIFKNHCSSSPCQNNGTCINEDNDFNCNCTGWCIDNGSLDELINSTSN